MISQHLLQTPWSVHHWDEIDSTSLEAQRRAQQGVAGPCWLTASVQTAGRGRQGRPWVSKSGNLYSTALLPIDALTREISTLSLTVGLAVRDAVVDATQGRVIPGLKWPNDVRVDGAKLCGILLETGRSDNTGYWLSIGIGLNINFAPEIPEYKTVCLKGLLPDLLLEPRDMLTIVDRFLRFRMNQQQDRGLSSIVEDWCQATDQWGQSYTAHFGNKAITGRFAGLNSMGELMLKTEDGSLVNVSAGDVIPLTMGAENAARN